MGWPEPLKNYFFKFACENTGKTPAKNIGYRAGIWIFDSPYPPSGGAVPRIAEIPSENSTGAFPNDEVDFTGAAKARFDDLQIKKVKNLHASFIVGLKIRYEDVFGEWHETERYIFITGPENSWTSVELSDCSRIT